jgi:antitoxin MazE
MITSVQKWGNSQAVRLPKSILESLFIKENDAVEITAEQDAIVIKKAARPRRAKKSLDERFAGYDGGFICSEYDWGEPAGKEVW